MTNTASASSSWNGGPFYTAERAAHKPTTHSDMAVHFLDSLRTRKPMALEEEGLDISGSNPDIVRRVYLLLAAAVRSLSPVACREVHKCWSNSHLEPLNRRTLTYVDHFWTGICEWCPEEPKPGSPAAVYTAAQLHEAEGDKRAALDLYMTIADKHPLAAARAAKLGGRERRLAGWRRYQGPLNGRCLLCSASPWRWTGCRSSSSMRRKARSRTCMQYAHAHIDTHAHIHAHLILAPHSHHTHTRIHTTLTLARTLATNAKPQYARLPLDTHHTDTDH